MDNQDRFFRIAFPKLASNEAFMAHYLREYGLVEGISQGQIMLRHNLSFEQIKKLALCKAPVIDSENFNQAVRELSNYSAIDFALIVQIVRKISYRKKFGDFVGKGGRVLLAAAREHSDDLDAVQPNND